MRISHNVPALVTYNAVSSTQSDITKAIQKLSTGLRINSAADDAAGLAISEKMRSQIRGLGQAARNSQDGVSMIQTAEGALHEVHSMLQRMRELAVQAANDTLTAQDRSYIQDEVDHLKDAIDRIAGTTQFNKKRLLDGSMSALWSSDKLGTEAVVKHGLTGLDQFGQKESAAGNYKIEISAKPGQAQVQKSNILDVSVTKMVTPGSGEAVTDVITEWEAFPPDGQRLESIQQTDDGGYITAGYSGYAYVAKLDADGNFLWNSLPAHFGVWSGELNSIQQTSDGGYIAAGQSDNLHTYAVKLDADGNVQWDNVDIGFGAGWLESIQQTDDGGYIAAGHDPSNCVVKLDADGNVLWNRHPLSSGGTLTSVQQTSDGGYIAAGSRSGSGGGIVKLDADGVVVWEKFFDGRFRSIQQTSDGGYIASGYSDSGGSDASYAVKLDAGGGVIWESSPGEYTLESIQQTLDGGYIATGNSTPGGAGNSYIVKLDANGGVTWEESFDGSRRLRSIQQTIDGGYIAAGRNGDTATAWVVKLRETVTTDNALSEIKSFYDGSGTFTMRDPKTVTIYQGDGQSANVTLNADDTMYTAAKKINDAIAHGLGQSAYVSDANKFCTVADGRSNTPESVYKREPIYSEAGYRRDENGGLISDDDGNPIWFESEITGYKIYSTMLIRSAIPGAAGELTFSGDGELLKALGLNTIQESSESEFTVTVYDAHSGKLVSGPQNISGNTIHDAIAGVDVRFDPLAGIGVTWNSAMKNYAFRAEGVYTTYVHLSDNTTILQTGANEGEDFMLTLGSVSSSSLGLDGLLTVSRETAARAITVLDGAINKVSAMRARLGAQQNRLEHTINSLTAAGTGLTAAESRIRDADMSKEMLDFTKLNILLQSGTAMMAQANQLPQAVLSLLR